MNSNRNKYSVTPTFGMQKKSFAKKLGLGVEQVSETPDFSQVPGYMSASTSFSAPSASSVNTPDYLNNPAQPAAPSYPPTYPQQGYAMPAYPGARAPQQTGFRAQPAPFPPQYPPYPGQMPAGSVPQPGYSAPVQQNPYSSPVQSYTGPSASAPQFRVQQAQAAQPQETNYPPQYSGAPSEPAFTSVPKNKAKPAAHQLISFFLFGVLPVMFLLAYLKAPLYYAFIALAAVGAGALWYKGMYSKGWRIFISILLIGMSVFGLVRIVESERLSASIPGGVQTRPAQENRSAPTEAPNEAFSDPQDLLETEPVETPAPIVEKSEAEKRLEAFMDLWKTNNAEAMVSYVQPSWVNKQTNASQSLFNLLANRTAENYLVEEISGTETDTSRTVIMTATINKNTGKAPSIYRFTIMMVKEGDLWYVNPNSLATNDEIAVTEEVVVNDSNASDSIKLATEPPRTTVSPAPPASTTLYYNQNGGSYYHMDQYCPSVKDEFLPLTGTFSYRDLAEYKETYKLQPCLRCGAPTTVLPETQE